MYDLIIIGGGPAGLSAALYAGRARMKTLLVEKTGLGGQIILTPVIENYPGFTGGFSTEKLVAAMEKQIRALEIDIKYDNVLDIISEGGFKVRAEEAGYQGRSLIIATGAAWKKLGVYGEDKFYARGVSYCGTCDAPLFKGKEVVVVGGGDKAVEEALYLTKFARKVTLIHRRQALRASKILQERLFADKKIQVIWNCVVEEIIGEKIVEGIKLKDLNSASQSQLSCQGVFIFIGITPNTGLVSNLVKIDEDRFILTDETMATSHKGIFAAGDCRKKTLQQVITACSDGAVAAVSAYRYLEDIH